MIAIIHKLTVSTSYHRTMKFTGLWTSAIDNLSPLLEQDITEDILKVCPQAPLIFRHAQY